MIGNDVSTILPDGTMDLDLSFAPISKGMSIAQRVLRAWMQPRVHEEDGTPMLEWAHDRGINLLAFVNADLTSTELSRLEMLLAGEARKEAGVLGIDVSARYLGDALIIAATLRTEDGDFELEAKLTDALPAILGVIVL